jgi:cytoskeletal protein CcmA (bactofilin family)
MGLFTSISTIKEAEEISTANNIVGKGSTINGEIDASANIRFEGTLKGNVRCKTKVVVSESATIDGNIYSTNADIAGTVLGNIEVSETLVLKSTCKITGDIKVGKLIVEAGAFYEGNCKMHSHAKKINPIADNASK